MARTPNVPPDVWNRHKDTLYGLLMEKWTYQKIAEHMKDAGPLDAPVLAYQRQFRKWRFIRNVSGRQAVRLLEDIEKRRRQGKDSRVWVGGKKQSDAKMKKHRWKALKYKEKQAHGELTPAASNPSIPPPGSYMQDSHPKSIQLVHLHRIRVVKSADQEPAALVALSEPGSFREPPASPITFQGSQGDGASAMNGMAVDHAPIELMDIDEVHESMELWGNNGALEGMELRDIDEVHEVMELRDIDEVHEEGVSDISNNIAWMDTDELDVMQRSTQDPTNYLGGSLAEDPFEFFAPWSQSGSSAMVGSPSRATAHTVASETRTNPLPRWDERPTMRLDRALEAQFSTQGLDIIFSETLPSHSLLQRSGISNLLHVMQEIGRLISNELMNSCLFFQLADHLGMDRLRNLTREAKKWSGNSPAQISFHENLSSWTLKYAIVRNHRRTIDELGPYTTEDLTYAMWNGRSDFFPVLLCGCTEDVVSRLWDVFLGCCYSHENDLYYAAVTRGLPLNLSDIAEFLGLVDQLFPNLTLEWVSQIEEGTSFSNFLTRLQYSLPQDGSWDSSALRIVLELITKMGADFHEGIGYFEEGRTTLQEATLAQNVGLVSLLLQQGANPNQPMGTPIDESLTSFSSSLGCTFHFIATGENHKAVVEIVEILISSMPGSKFCDCAGQCYSNSIPAGGVRSRIYPFSPILEAIASGNTQVVSLLLDMEASLLAEHPTFGTLPALQFAAQFDNTEILCLLLDAGASVNAVACDDGEPEYRSPQCMPRTALEAASLAGHVQVIEVLLSRGAWIMCEDRNALEFALRAGHYGAAHVLLDNIDDQKTRILWEPRLEPRQWYPVLPHIDLVDALWSGDYERAEIYLNSAHTIDWVSLRLPEGSKIHFRHNGSSDGQAWCYRTSHDDTHDCECDCNRYHESMPIKEKETPVNGSHCLYEFGHEYRGTITIKQGGVHWDANPLPYVCRLSDHTLQVKFAKLLLKSGCNVNARVPYEFASGRVELESTLGLAIHAVPINYELVRTLLDAKADLHSALHSHRGVRPRSSLLGWEHRPLFWIMLEKRFRFPRNCPLSERAWKWAKYRDIEMIECVQHMGFDINENVKEPLEDVLHLSGVDPAVVSFLLRMRNCASSLQWHDKNNFSLLDGAVQLGSTDILETVLALWDAQFGDSLGESLENPKRQQGQGVPSDLQLGSVAGSLILKNAVHLAVERGRLDCLHLLLHNRQRYFSEDFIRYITWLSRQYNKYGIAQYLDDFCEEHGSESFGRLDPISVSDLLNKHWDHKRVYNSKIGQWMHNPHYLLSDGSGISGAVNHNDDGENSEAIVTTATT